MTALTPVSHRFMTSVRNATTATAPTRAARASGIAAAVSVELKSHNAGNLIICLDPGLFVDRRVFCAEVSEFITRAKSTNLLPEVDEVMLPGERGDRLAVANRAVATVEVDEAVFAALTKVIR